MPLNKKTISALALSSAILAGGTVWAQETAPRTTATAEEVTRGMKAETVSIKPELGIIAYTDTQDNSTSRGVAGLGVDWNFGKLLMSGTAGRDWYLGLSTGAIYSHLGSSGSNFFGSSPDVVSSAPGANLLVIPTDLKLGYNLTDASRVSIHGGGNVVYRSVANSMSLGPSTSVGDNSVWRMYPNAGASFEFGSGNVAFIARPDFTFTPGSDIFTGTLGVGITLG